MKAVKAERSVGQAALDDVKAERSVGLKEEEGTKGKRRAGKGKIKVKQASKLSHGSCELY